MMKLLKISNPSVDKPTGLVEQLMGDNAKLLKLVAEKEEEACKGIFIPKWFWD